MWNITWLEYIHVLDMGSTTSRGLQVLYIYPSTKEPDWRTLFMTLYLIGCLTIGLCGNFSQIMLQYYAYRLRIYNSDSSPNCTQVRILDRGKFWRTMTKNVFFKFSKFCDFER